MLKKLYKCNVCFINRNLNKENCFFKQTSSALMENRILACLLTIQSCLWNDDFEGQERYTQLLAVPGPARVSHVIVLHHQCEAAPGEICSDTVMMHNHTGTGTEDKSRSRQWDYPCLPLTGAVEMASCAHLTLSTQLEKHRHTVLISPDCVNLIPSFFCCFVYTF